MNNNFKNHLVYKNGCWYLYTIYYELDKFENRSTDHYEFGTRKCFLLCYPFYYTSLLDGAAAR